MDLLGERTRLQGTVSVCWRNRKIFWYFRRESIHCTRRRQDVYGNHVERYSRVLLDGLNNLAPITLQNTVRGFAPHRDQEDQGRVAPGGHPPGAPTEPYVHALLIIE